MSTALIVRDDAKLTISFTESAIALKQHALERAALIGKVDASNQQEAVDTQKELANVVSLVEKARKQAKEPVLDYGRTIDSSAASFVEEPKAELTRLAGNVGDFQKLEEARVRAAEQARLAEQRRLENERRAEEDRVRREAAALKAKLDAEAAEALRKANEAKNAEARARAELDRKELERQKALAEAKSHEELDRINQRHCEEVAALPITTPIRAEGQRVRGDWDIQVVDIWTLARAHPVCVKIEPRLSEIRNLLDAGVKVAGVTAKRVVKSGVTSGRAMKAIEV